MIFRGPTYLEVKTFVQETSNAEDVQPPHHCQRVPEFDEGRRLTFPVSESFSSHFYPFPI